MTDLGLFLAPLQFPGSLNLGRLCQNSYQVPFNQSHTLQDRRPLLQETAPLQDRKESALCRPRSKTALIENVASQTQSAWHLGQIPFSMKFTASNAKPSGKSMEGIRVGRQYVRWQRVQ